MGKIRNDHHSFYLTTQRRIEEALKVKEHCMRETEERKSDSHTLDWQHHNIGRETRSTFQFILST